VTDPLFSFKGGFNRRKSWCSSYWWCTAKQELHIQMSQGRKWYILCQFTQLPPCKISLFSLHSSTIYHYLCFCTTKSDPSFGHVTGCFGLHDSAWPFHPSAVTPWLCPLVVNNVRLTVFLYNLAHVAMKHTDAVETCGVLVLFCILN